MTKGFLKIKGLKFTPVDESDPIESGYFYYKESTNSFILSQGSSPIVVPLGNNISINTVTSSTYTIQASDNNKLVILNDSTSVTVTLPNNTSVSIPVGTKIDCVQGAVGAVTFSPDTNVTINSKGGNKKTNGQCVAVSLLKTDTNTWYLFGDLTS